MPDEKKPTKTKTNPLLVAEKAVTKALEALRAKPEPGYEAENARVLLAQVQRVLRSVTHRYTAEELAAMEPKRAVALVANGQYRGKVKECLAAAMQEPPEGQEVPGD